jgi:hypothetical protein
LPYRLCAGAFDNRRVDHLGPERHRGQAFLLRFSERPDYFAGTVDLLVGRHERLVDDAYLAGMDAALAFKPEGLGFENARPQSVHVADVGEHGVNCLDPGRTGRVHDLGTGPEALATFVGALGAEVCGVVLKPDGQRSHGRRRLRDVVRPDDAERALHYRHEPDFAFPLAGRLMHAVSDRTHLARVFCLGDEDELDPGLDKGADLFEAARKLVDADHELRGAEVKGAEHVPDQHERGVLLRRGDRVFEVEDDAVRLVDAGVEHELGLVARQVEPGTAPPVPSARLSGVIPQLRQELGDITVRVRAPNRGLCPGHEHDGKCALVLDLDVRVFDTKRLELPAQQGLVLLVVEEADFALQSQLDAARFAGFD